MNIKDLHTLVKTPIFTTQQVKSIFRDVNSSNVLVQLNRWSKNNEIIRLKRGLYIFKDVKVEEYAIAQALYNPSYVSLESALNHQGIIPDIPETLTSVCSTTPRTFETPLGKYRFSRIQPKLFFGYTLISDSNSGLLYHIASPAKALLDLIYIRNYRSITDLRVDWTAISKTEIKKYSLLYPDWVQAIIKQYV
jgi:predicted transcriptional regulator of viral defense system